MNKGAVLIMPQVDVKPKLESGNSKINVNMEAFKDETPFGEMDLKFYSYEMVEDIAKHLLERTKHRPRIAIICGSGLGSLADTLEDQQVFRYEDIPYFPISTVKGHAGRLVFGVLKGAAVVCMQGRFHCYEGHPLWRCVMPIRLMKLLGISHLIVTNAAGGINKKFKVGDIMIIKDHIDMMGYSGNSALNGPNDERFGPRFPAVNKAYDKSLRIEAKEIAKELGIQDIVHEGVYTCVGGPNYETIAELKMLRHHGADAVGMSTVPEVVTAKYCGIKTLAFSLISNDCVFDYDSDREPNHEEVIKTGRRMEPILKKFVSRVVERMYDSIQNTSF